jgi:deoxyguanosine kinase
MTVTAYIGLGSNLGDREGFLNKALKLVGDLDQVQITSVSDMIESYPLGNARQPDYLNAAAKLESGLSAIELHRKLQDIEIALGRQRSGKWQPRTIDMDLLLFGDQVINTPDLAVPHPQMHLRSFVLKGLSQIAPQVVHPLLKQPACVLAQRLNGNNFVIDKDVPQVISIAGTIGVGKTTLVKNLGEKLNCATVFEPYDKNPFLPQVYAGKNELALDSQLYFLTARASQLNPDTLPCGKIILTDYIFQQEEIYAAKLLDPEQLKLYMQVYPSFALAVAKPVLVIYLTDSAQKCLERIKSRNRPYEQTMKQSYLESLINDYDKLFENWKTSPVIRISKSDFDCANSNDIDFLMNQIKFYTAF